MTTPNSTSTNSTSKNYSESIDHTITRCASVGGT